MCRSQLTDLMEHACAARRILDRCRQHDLVDGDGSLRTATLLVEQRVLYDAAEPGIDPCRISELPSVLQRVHERTLQNILGVEADLYLTWQITSDVTFAMRYGGFIPGPAIEGDSGLRNFFFAGVTYAF